MIRALYSAGSGMTAQQMSIDNIANNLANANTTGFKERRTQFQDLLYQNVMQPGAAAGAQTVVPSGLQLGLGTRPSAQLRSCSRRGTSPQTDNPLDLVIQGKGFFQIQLPNGQTAYTRAGNFQLDKNGNIVDTQRQSATTADHDSGAGAVDHDRDRRHGELHPAGADGVANGGADPARQLHQSGRVE